MISLNTLKSILSSMDAYLFVSDLETDEILFINDRMKEYFRLGDDSVGSICWQVLQSGLTQRCEFCPKSQLVRDPETPVLWEEHNTATGRYYKNSDRIIEWSDGKKVHLQYSEEITDLKLAEASLKKQVKQQELTSAISQGFASATVEDTPRLICTVLKMTGEIMNADQAFLSKYQKDERALDCLYEWHHEEGRSIVKSKDKWPLPPDTELFRELTVNGYAAINGDSLRTRLNFPIVEDQALSALLLISIEVSREFWGIIGFALTERPQNWSESDIHIGKSIAGVLSGAIRRNTEEKNLLRAKETAEQGSRAKGEFLSRMSHEMKTPMNAIIGMTGIARNSKDPQKKEYCLEKIDNASKQLLAVINDILDMSEIEANEVKLFSDTFEFEKMLINITNVIGFRVEEKKQNFIIDIDKNVPSVLIGDETRLSQVIANLLTNASKFTPEGGTIILNAHKIDGKDEVSTLLIEVIDNGIGISKEQRAQLFASFEQADGGTARKYSGTGLGLAICKGIIELMNGRIWLESELGQGAKFCFTIQIKTGKEELRPKLDEAVDRSNIRILAVDDTPEMRNYFTHVMPSLGLFCDVADSGAAALEMIENKKNSQQYNIFFIDRILPDLNGLELAHKIKRITGDNVVILMTSMSDWVNIEKEALAAGVDKFISKPLFPSTLINVINELIGTTPALKAVRQKLKTPDHKSRTLLPAEDEQRDDSPQEMKALTYGDLLPALDVKDGLSRVMGNKNLYFRLLKAFSGRKLVDEVITALENNDFSQTIQAAYALKGVSANLGLVELFKAAGAIEVQMKNDGKIESYIHQLNQALDEATLAIQTLLANEEMNN